MKKVFRIVLALALVLTLGVMSAVPAAAVTPGTITVEVDPPLAGKNATYTICFHNGSFLEGGVDYIDVMFPVGTSINATPAVVTSVKKGTSCAKATLAVAFAYTIHSATTVRISLNTTDEDIYKCEYVEIVITGVVNPKSCFHHLQVGTSTHTPSASDDYAIYTAKITLAKGKNLIALPAYPADTSIEVVLADLFAKAAKTAAMTTPFTFSVWYWDAWGQVWLKYMSDSSQSDLTVMEAGKAYWIKPSAAISFYFKGDPYPECQGPPQKWSYPESWSMIGITGTLAMDASEFLKDAMLPWPQQNTYAVSTIFGFTGGLLGVYYDTGWIPGQKSDTTWMGSYGVAWPGPSDALLQPAEGYFMSFLGPAVIIPPLP